METCEEVLAHAVFLTYDYGLGKFGCSHPIPGICATNAFGSNRANLSNLSRVLRFEKGVEFKVIGGKAGNSPRSEEHAGSYMLPYFMLLYSM